MDNSKRRYSWFTTSLTILTIAISLLLFFNINKFGGLSKKFFIFLNLFFFVGSLLLLLMTTKFNSTNNKKHKIIYAVFLVFLTIGVSYGYYITNLIDVSISNITTQNRNIKYEASFVVRKDTYKDKKELKDKTVGLISSPEFIEGNILAKDELTKLKYTDVEEKSYNSYASLINALVKEEVDFIALPKQYKALFYDDEQISHNLEHIESIHDFSGRYKSATTFGGSDMDVTKVPFTVLLMGNDGDRTDTLILATVNPNAMQVTLTSIARDSYVPIACNYNQARDKINHARVVSRDCAIKTVENLLDISVDFFVEIKFQGVVDLVNALGGLEVDSPAAFAGNIVRDGEVVGGVSIPLGVSELNGDQVLAFVRERNSFSSGDFARQENQQQVIEKLLSKILETRDVNVLIDIVKAMGDNVVTNMSLNQMVSLMNLGIVRMESTFLKNANVFNIHGNRITGRGAMLYRPELDMNIYYYILYNGSIADSKALIAKNLRSDGLVENPRAFNYSYLDVYQPPVFSNLDYLEGFSSEILEEMAVKPEEKGEEFEIPQFSGKLLSELEAFFAEHGLKYEIVETTIEISDDKDLLNKTFVISDTEVTLNEDDVLTIKVVIYKDSIEEDPEVPLPGEDDNDPDEDDNDPDVDDNDDGDNNGDVNESDEDNGNE